MDRTPLKYLLLKYLKVLRVLPDRQALPDLPALQARLGLADLPEAMVLLDQQDPQALLVRQQVSIHLLLLLDL